VNAETAARIRQVADELGYRANPVTQAPVTSQTRLLGLMVSDVANPFYSQLIRGAQSAATETGYELLLVDSRESSSRERASLERLVPVVEGFVIGSSRMSDSALRTIAKQRPMVTVNRALLDVPSVITDNTGGVRAAVELLVSLGHETVAYVAGPEASWTDGVRFRALRDLGPKVGLNAQKVGPFLPTFEGGLAAARTLRDKSATAVIAYNDLMAIGIMHGLLREGVAVPDQVSVIGFDDILISRLVTPALTTVAAPLRQMGSTAVANVVALIGGAKHRSTEPLVMPTQLKVRNSTAARGRGVAID
jgi:Transcriptional regulators